MSDAPSSDFVRTRVVDHVGWLSFDRPPVNAFEWTMVRQVSEALDRFAADGEVRVIVLADGFEYEGERYRTLSAVARKITGTHVNGFRFFNLEGGK